MTTPPARLGAAPLLLILIATLAGCAAVSKEQAETEALMWAAARECQGRYSTIQTIERIDSYGRLHFSYHGSGHENAAFLQCYGQRSEEKVRASASLPAERVALDPDAGRRIVVRIQRAGSAAIVPVRLNGTVDARLLVDTGSTWTVLSPKIAAKLELPITASTRRSITTLVGGSQIAMPRVRLSVLKLGGAVVENLHVGVYEVFPQGPEVDGLLGMDFLRHFRVSIDRQRGQLVLDLSD